MCTKEKLVMISISLVLIAMLIAVNIGVEITYFNKPAEAEKIEWVVDRDVEYEMSLSGHLEKLCDDEAYRKEIFEWSLPKETDPKRIKLIEKALEEMENKE